MSVLRNTSKDEAIVQLQKIVSEQDSIYDLVPFDAFKSGKNLRSNCYKGFHVLCYANTCKEAGCLVCNYALTGGCKLSQELLTFNTSTGGTGRLAKHMEQHTSKKANVTTLPKSICHLSKANIYRSAAMAVALDLRPISFTDRQEGILHFIEATFRAGQFTPDNDRVDPETLLP